MLDEIVSVVPFRDRFLVIYRSGRVLEMAVWVDVGDRTCANFTHPTWEIPRSIS
jgi:hypothetical protein